MKKEHKLNIFLVEDDPQYAASLKYDIECHTPHNIRCFSSGEECVKHVKEMPDVVLLDYFLEGKLTGLDVLKQIRKFNANIQVVLLSGQDKIEVATNGMKLGAYDYIVKNQNAFIRTRNVINKLTQLKGLKRDHKSFIGSLALFFVIWSVMLGILFYLVTYIF